MTNTASKNYSDGVSLAESLYNHPWVNTAIGPVESWPPELRALLGVMLGSKQPMFTVWGPKLTLLYNDAYRSILGDKDRNALGRSFLDVWDEVRTDLAPLVDRSLSGDSVHMDDITLFVDREGQKQEAHFAFSYTPVRDGAGDVRGFFCACNETTTSVTEARRQAFRLDLEISLRELDEANSIIKVAAQNLGQHLRADRVFYSDMTAKDAFFFRLQWSGSSSLTDKSFALQDLDLEAEMPLRHGQSVTVTEVLPSFARPGILPPIGAYVAVPARRGTEIEAILLVAAAPRNWSKAEVSLIESVATLVNNAVQRIRAKQEVLASAANLRSLMSAMANQVWTATSDGTVNWVNERAAEYLGVMHAKDSNFVWIDFMHAEDVSASDNRWQAAINSGLVYEVEFRLRRADGVYRWHLARAVADRDQAGQILRWIGTNTDIDDQKRAELDLAAAKVVAEEANLAKSAFIANMSHELRTPLSAIIGYSEMMAEEMSDGCKPGELASDMAKVESNARHLLGLINDVLDLSKVESGKMDVFTEEFAIEPTLREVASTVASLVANKGNTLQLELAPDLGTMRSDLVKLRQMLLNLLSNAAKFMENGVITLSAVRQPNAEDGRCLVFAVKDTGIGMSHAQLSKLFQRFAQADASTTRRFGGTGLGLSLTKAFADMLGATIDVDSAPDEGTTFTLRFPVGYVPVVDEVPPALVQSEVNAGQELILVIDDDADQRALITRFLHREGFRVQTAADGRSGLELARQLRPRAIMLDVMMPGIDGWSVLTELKADPDLKSIPVIMVSATDQRTLAAALGAADYMLKPVNWERFRDLVSRFRTSQGSILLVEDDFASRSNMRVMLEEDGWSVTEAANGKLGLGAAAANPPSLVLLDLSMPVMDGFAFIEQVRALPGCSEIPIVVMTARNLSREERQRLRGVSQILNKGDISLAELTNRLKNLGETE